MQNADAVTSFIASRTQGVAQSLPRILAALPNIEGLSAGSCEMDEHAFTALAGAIQDGVPVSTASSGFQRIFFKTRSVCQIPMYWLKAACDPDGHAT